LIEVLWQARDEQRFRLILPEWLRSMIRASEFLTVAVQASLFTEAIGSFDAQSLLGSIWAEGPDRYDGPVFSLPIPPSFHVPDEVVRASVQSKDGNWKIEAAGSRINSFWQKVSDSDECPADVVPQCARFLERYSRSYAHAVNRLALVITSVSEKPNPGQLLIDSFCNTEAQSGPLQGSASFELHNHKVYSLPGNPPIYVNSWVRCRTGFLGEDKRPALVVEQDMNTVIGSEPTVFKPTQVSKFYRSAAMELNKILKEYFPDPSRRG
jgi:hypothetical protein